MKVLCVFGKDQYGDVSRGLSTEFFSFVPAIESLGYEVEFFDSWNRNLYTDFIDLNQKLIEKVEATKPDIIFSVQFNYEIWMETWDYISNNFQVKTVNWCTDDSWKYAQHSKFIAEHFDLMVTTYEEFIIDYKKQGVEAVVSNWAVPVQWLKPPKKGIDCTYKTVFIGMAHGNRRDLIEQIRAMGVDVTCFGHGWETGAIDAERIPEIINDSVLSLNFSNSSGENQIKARTFEVPGCGGCLLTANAKNLEKFFTDEKDLIIFEGIEDCVSKIKKIQSNLELRDQVALNGFEKVKNNYTYKIEIEKIFKKLETIQKRKSPRVNYSEVITSHRQTFFTKLLRSALLFLGRMLFKGEKATKFSRRLMFEFSWRVLGENTYLANGLMGRIFYKE